MNIITKLFETTIPSIENMKNESAARSEEHTSELQSRSDLVCRLLLEKKKHVKHAADDRGLAHVRPDGRRPDHVVRRVDHEGDVQREAAPLDVAALDGPPALAAIRLVQ